MRSPIERIPRPSRPACRRLVPFVFAVLSALALPAQEAGFDPEELALKPKIDEAIDRGVEYLLEEQLRDGSWGLHSHLGGRAGLTLYTLLHCGVSRDHPAVKRAVAYLDSVEPTATYATATMLLAYDALRMGREERIEHLIEKIVSWQKPHGDWAYPHSHEDLSNTQYAALALWIAVKRDIDVDRDVFYKLAERVEDYREEPTLIDNPDLVDGRTGAPKVEVAGFRYRVGNGPTTGSMTGAAIAVLAICKAGIGKRLSSSVRRRIDELTDGGMRWLAQRFSPARNPNGGHHLYYLYGLERVGALLQTERIGEHRWYLEGARHLLKSQKQDNGWGNVTETCFALLFLRRATSQHSPTTGSSGSVAHVFEAGDDKADIRLRGAGQRPLSLWIDGFGDKIQQVHGTYGLRVVDVSYVDAAGNVLGKVAGDPTKTWQNATFLHRDEVIARGSHKVRARVTLMAPDAGPGNDGTVRLESPWMDVKIRDVMAPWMVDSRENLQNNLLREAEPEFRASSELGKNSAAGNVCDGQDGTLWLAAHEDENPSLLIEWRRSERVGSVAVLLPAQHESKLRDYDRIDGVEVRLGNDRNEWHKLPMGHDPIAPLVFELDRSRRLRSIELRFYGRKNDSKGSVGFAEVILLPPKRRR